MKPQLKSTILGAVIGPIILLLTSLCTSGIMTVLWGIPSRTVTGQTLTAVIWDSFLGAITSNIHFHYNRVDFIRAKRICLMYGTVLSFIFLAGLLFRLANLNSFTPPDIIEAMPAFNPSKTRWLALTFFGSGSSGVF